MKFHSMQHHATSIVPPAMRSSMEAIRADNFQRREGELVPTRAERDQERFSALVRNIGVLHKGTHIWNQKPSNTSFNIFLWLSCQKESPSSTTDLMIGILGSCSLGTNMNMEVDKVSATVENQYREISLSKVVRFLFPKTWWVKMYLHWM